VSPTGPEAEQYGAANGYPIGDRSNYFQQAFLVGALSHMDEIFEARLVRRAAAPSSLGRPSSEPQVRYDYRGESLELDQYLARNPTTGLLIARDDAILVERYQYARNDRHRLTSFSMAKTVTSMLIGIAIAEGRIRSVDDPASAYVPALAGTEYGRTPIRHLLQMSSGVRFLEEYSGRDDVTKLAMDTFWLRGPGGAAAVSQFSERIAPSGTRYSYASAETQVLGLVVAQAVGRSVSAYLQEKIWQPIGAEADATWLVDRTGQEATFCCLNAVLRDWGRLGLLLAHEGSWRGRQIIPATWIREATSVRREQPYLAPRTATRFYGYGYQTWIFPDEPWMFALLGIRGQTIFVDQSRRLVMVHTAVRKLPVDPAGAETVALWRGVVRDLGR
jgi:CubicO group peptidase (beta-lactamase class C family)